MEASVRFPTTHCAPSLVDAMKTGESLTNAQSSLTLSEINKTLEMAKRSANVSKGALQCLVYLKRINRK
jgi:hypothetical protein